MYNNELFNQQSQILIYQSADGSIKIDVRLEDETVWLTQAQMGQLFGKGRTTITEHIRNIFAEGELQEEVVCRNFRHTTVHGAISGKTQEVTTRYYNIALGYQSTNSGGIGLPAGKCKPAADGYAIVRLNGRELLNHAGTISHELALQRSGEEFEKYAQAQRALEYKQSLGELEEDIKQLKQNK